MKTLTAAPVTGISGETSAAAQTTACSHAVDAWLRACCPGGDPERTGKRLLALRSAYRNRRPAATFAPVGHLLAALRRVLRGDGVR